MYLALDHLSKRFGEVEAAREVSLQIEKGETLALLGPSGSGKTTVLRLVAGFERPDAGRVLIEGEEVTHLPAEKRRFGMVFQNYALFPHMTVAENVAFGLEAHGLPKLEIERRVAEMLVFVDLSGFEKRKVTEISGGEQQRVALARSLAPNPRVLLLDEPLSNLDPSLRERTRRELKQAIRRVGITTVFVTHEQEEAFELGDRVALINRGSVEQVGTPDELYEKPASRFVATFIGRSSVIAARWETGVGKAGRVRLADGKSWSAVAREEFEPGSAVDLVTRPEGLSLSKLQVSDGIRGRVLDRRYAGRVAYYSVALEGGGQVDVFAPSDAARLGETVYVSALASALPPQAFRREMA